MNLVKLLESLDGMSVTMGQMGVTTNLPKRHRESTDKDSSVDENVPGATGGVQGQVRHRRAAAVMRAADTNC